MKTNRPDGYRENYSELFVQWFEQKKHDFRLSKTIRKSVESMAWQSSASSDVGKVRIAKIGKYLFSAISIFLGYTYLAYYLESSSGKLMATVLAVIGMLAVEVGKHGTISPAFRKYYKGAIDADFWLYGVLGLAACGLSIFCAFEGAKTVYNVQVLEAQETAIKTEYDTRKDQIYNDYEADKAAFESYLKNGADSVRDIYQSQITENKRQIQDNIDNQSNYLMWKGKWTLRERVNKVNAELAKTNIALQKKSVEEPKAWQQQQRQGAIQEMTSKRDRLLSEIAATKTDLSVDLNKKSGKELPIIKCLSIGTEVFILVCIGFTYRYDYNVFSEYKILTGDTEGNSVVKAIQERFQLLYINSLDTLKESEAREFIMQAEKRGYEKAKQEGMGFTATASAQDSPTPDSKAKTYQDYVHSHPFATTVIKKYHVNGDWSLSKVYKEFADHMEVSSSSTHSKIANSIRAYQQGVRANGNPSNSVRTECSHHSNSRTPNEHQTKPNKTEYEAGESKEWEV